MRAALEQRDVTDCWRRHWPEYKKSTDGFWKEESVCRLFVFSCLLKMKEIELFETVNYDIEIQIMDIANCFRKTAEDGVRRGDLFVLEDEGGVVAAAVINQIQVPEYRYAAWKHRADDSEVMVLHALVVDPHQKGRGYGKAFVAFYEDYAKEHNCVALRMDTNARNVGARNLYHKLGYE